MVDLADQRVDLLREVMQEIDLVAGAAIGFGHQYGVDQDRHDQAFRVVEFRQPLTASPAPCAAPLPGPPGRPSGRSSTPLRVTPSEQRLRIVLRDAGESSGGPSQAERTIANLWNRGHAKAFASQVVGDPSDFDDDPVESVVAEYNPAIPASGDEILTRHRRSLRVAQLEQDLHDAGFDMLPANQSFDFTIGGRDAQSSR